jgi:hypothetical protein
MTPRSRISSTETAGHSSEEPENDLKNNVQGWVLFAFALPAVIVGYLWLLLLCLLWVGKWSTLRFQGAGVLTVRSRDWAAKFWGFSTTIGRAVLYHPSAYDGTAELDNRVEHHEFVHIKQWEDACMASFLGGLIVALVGWTALGLNAGNGLTLWALVWSMGAVTFLPNFLTAVLRYGLKGIYRDTEHERSAYACTDIRSDGKSWEQERDEQGKQRDKAIS